MKTIFKLINITFLIFMSSIYAQDCDDSMLMYDCDETWFCNNEPDWGYDCFVYNEFCQDFNDDGIIEAWVGDGWCDDGQWGYDFQCSEYSFDCGDCGDTYTDYNNYCTYLPDEYTFLYQNINREYLLYLPESLNENAPLIFIMHGFTGSANGIYSYSGMQSIADENGFAVCYPNGTIDQNGNRFWNVGYNFHQNIDIDDVGFLVALSEYLQNEYNLSSENTFAAGMSNGAEMSYMLACFANDHFKAIAPVAGTMFGESWSNCLADPTPILEIHGTNDNITLWDGNPNDNYWGPYPGVEDVIDFWIENNSCSSNENILLTEMNTVKHRYFDCIDNSEVWLYEVINGGHDWPDYASDEIWNFFSLYLLFGDLNQDNTINILDVITLVSLILNPNTEISGDLNSDDLTNIQDIIILLNIILS
tara:strand:- start:548 stop:1804 length:1257 start_codon:yes stop_codon:yes gene_type:complete